jgi:hypothetical protein
MSQNFGREMPPPHVQQVHRHAARYLVVIPGPDGPIARFFGANREPLAELDANTEEVTTMLKGLTPAMGAGDMDWSSKLSGHSPQERASALIYTLDV